MLNQIQGEINKIIDEIGWNRNALNQFAKVDSFIKESQRLNASVQAIHILRWNVHTPGTLVEVAAFATHLDDANYPNPTKLDPFPFVDKTKAANRGRKVEMVSTHADFVAFGHGLHVCPRRFFAPDVLRLILVHVVMNYDVRFRRTS